MTHARPVGPWTDAVQRAAAAVTYVPAVGEGARGIARDWHTGVRPAQAALARPPCGTGPTIQVATTTVTDPSAIGREATWITASQRNAGIQAVLDARIARDLGRGRDIPAPRGIRNRGCIPHGASQGIPPTGEAGQHDNGQRSTAEHRGMSVHSLQRVTAARRGGRRSRLRSLRSHSREGLRQEGHWPPCPRLPSSSAPWAAAVRATRRS